MIAAEQFRDQVAIVTGGAGGIGQAVCRALAAHGAAVAVADLDRDGATAIADEITAAGGTAAAAPVDLADETDVARMVADVVDRFGRIDIVDNNAALTDADVLARDTNVTDMALEVWDAMMAVNLRSQLLVCKHAIPPMVESGGGAIVNMSSGAANTADLTRTAYSVSKAGITAFTKHVATQYGRQGVRANCIVPGLILTDPVRAQIPPKMLEAYASGLLTTFVGEPDDIAELVMFLVSPASRYITGQSIAIDGGLSVHSARLTSSSTAPA
jgi:NAD(P)-dependent dehydrogenase (short-subunit alcohol dehydrogenase family)